MHPNHHLPGNPAPQPNSNMQKGEVLKFDYKNSTLYPGTTRAYWVYIPAVYKPSMPACLYVCLDGILFNAPDVFDSLVNNGHVPVIIGVFIQPGTVLREDGTVLRYNRSNEFDSLTDRFARFIEEEILPDVQTRTATDGRKINISPHANDHAIGGASSGAICAFTAAWQRPALFSRVFSAIGTYVGMRGGDQYLALVRKTEPKPIRIYLQDNSNGTWNPLFGNWLKANIEMEAALTFAGYEVAYLWQEGGHDTKQATTIFASAMRWLWKGWPQPVKSGRSANAMLRTILDEHEDWRLVTQQAGGTALAATASGEIEIKDNTGVLLMPGGARYMLKAGKDSADGIIVYRQRGKRPLVADKDRFLGYTMAVSPDKRQLVVSCKHSHWLYSYTVKQDGKLADKQKLYWLHNPGNDDISDIRSMAFDNNGNLYAATEIGIQVCDPDGRVRAILSLPDGAVTAVCFGGEKFETLFAVCYGKLYKRKLKVVGTPSWAPAVKAI